MISQLHVLLNHIHESTSSHPPLETQSRFGNPAFKTWLSDLPSLLDLHLDFIPLEHRQELKEYLLVSFGNPSRIDYGTGHETHFIVFLLCLDKIGLFNAEQDYPHLVLVVFWRYILLMRHLTTLYWLEPAGSHGVWGLDDYHFLPFLFGSWQLAPHKFLTPKCIHNQEILSEFSRDYMYLSCVSFVNSIKSASLRWHSPMLDDISSAKSWSKIANGMINMYKADVLGKLPIMQHMLFGSLYSFQGGNKVNPVSFDGYESFCLHIV